MENDVEEKRKYLIENTSLRYHYYLKEMFKRDVNAIYKMIQDVKKTKLNNNPNEPK